VQRILGPLALAALLAGCVETASIQGNVTVGPGQEGLAVFAVLWEVDTTTGSRPQLVALGTQSLGVAQAGTSTFKYSFYGLQRGTYVVGAWADLHDDREITDDAITADTLAPLEVDPADAARRLVRHDVFLGASGPDKATVRGTLHVAAAGVGSTARLYALDRPVNDPEAQVLATAAVVATAATPFSLFNVPPGPVHLFAQVDVGDDESEGNDLFAIHAMNPLTLAQGGELAGQALWAGVQAPDLGSIAGRLVFNAALPSLAVQLVVLAPTAQAGGPPALSDTAAIEAIVNVDAGGRVEVPFELPSLRPGLHFVAALVRTADADGTVRQAQRIYSVASKETAIDTRDEGARDVRFSLGVGRCSGSIRLAGAPSTLRSVAVFALVPGVSQGPGLPGQPAIYEAQAIPVSASNGQVTTAYQLFGLEDGTYDLALIPDLNGDGSYQEEYAAERIYDGAPLRVTVEGGGRVGSDFAVTFAP
jgi:uncharacterized protein (DUF2141 family)